MWGRKARKIRELEIELWRAKDENFELKQTIAQLKDLRQTIAGVGLSATRNIIAQQGKMQKKKNSKPERVVREKDDSGPGFATGLLAGAILNDLLSGDANNNSTEPEPFSGGGGEFGGAGANGDWGGNNE